jgi:hypothetical protein
MNWHSSSRFIVRYLDIFIALIGVFVAAAVSVWMLYAGGASTKVLLFPVIAFFLASLLYLILGRKLCIQTLTLGDFKSYRPFYLLSSAVFFLLFSLTLGIVFARQNPGIRPVSYFILTAVMMGLLGVEIAYLPSYDGGKYVHFTSAKLTILLASLYLLPSLLHPGLLRDDPWAHSVLARKVVETGHIPEGHPYAKLPIMHLLIASQMITSNTEYKLAAMFSLTLVHLVVTVLSMLWMGRYLFHDDRIGLLGALLFLSSGRSILHGSIGTPTAFATAFLLLVIYLAFRSRSSAKSIQINLIYISVSLWLVLVHSLTPAALLFLLIVAYLIPITLKWLRIGSGSEITTSFCILLAVALFSYWMYASGYWARFVLVIRWGFTKFGVVGSFTSPWAAEQIGKVSVLEFIFSVLGLSLVCVFAIMGMLHLFHLLEKYAGTIFIPVIAFVFIGLLALETIGHLGMAGDRWMYYALPFLGISAAVGLLAIPVRVRAPTLGVVIYACLIAAITFFSITDPLANDDNPLYAPEITPLRYFRSSELQAATRVCELWYGGVLADNDTRVCLYSNDTCSAVEYVQLFFHDLYDGDFSGYEGDVLLLIREHFQSEPIYSHGIFELNYDLFRALDEQRFSRVYDSGGMMLFQSPQRPQSPVTVSR